jgi:hypothetical protein
MLVAAGEPAKRWSLVRRGEDFLLIAPVERGDVALPPGSDDGIGAPGYEPGAERQIVEERGQVEERVLRPARGVGPTGVGGDEGLIRRIEGAEPEAEGVLHPRPPELGELVTEDDGRAFPRAIAVPAEADIKRVEAQRRPRQVAVRVHQHQCRASLTGRT